MKVVYNRILYHVTDDDGDGVFLKDGMYVPYSHPMLIDPTDDEVAGLPEPPLLFNEDSPTVSGLYLGLFHGSAGLDREKGREKFSDWGFNGPLIGPLNFVHTTYRDHIRLEFATPETKLRFLPFLSDRLCGIGDLDAELQLGPKGSEDCLVFNGDLYGDWSIFHCDLKADKPLGVLGRIRNIFKQ